MTVFQNDPSLWRDKLPVHKPGGHKYDRGVAVIYGAPKMTGATRLAARACARMGAGLVRVIAPEGTGEIYRTTLHEEIIVENAADFKGFDDPKIRAVLMGPGCPADKMYRDIFYEVMRAGHINGLVLDAGAFLSWQGELMKDFQAFNSDHHKVVVTPHEGEFKTFFESFDRYSSVLSQPTKIKQAQEAATMMDFTIVLKGAQTVIAGNKETIVNDRDVPALATAGTGDVLAGMITGLIAQGMKVQWASAAAVWIHAEAGARFGAGMVASDLPEMIPDVLRDLA